MIEIKMPHSNMQKQRFQKPSDAKSMLTASAFFILFKHLSI